MLLKFYENIFWEVQKLDGDVNDININIEDLWI